MGIIEDNAYPAVIGRTMRRTMREGLRAGEAALASIAFPTGAKDYPRHREHVQLVASSFVPDTRHSSGGGDRPKLDPFVARRVLRRGAWQCTWCGAKVIDGAVLRAISDTFPHIFPYHKSKPERQHPAIQSRWPAIDHRQPGSRGGSWECEDNLAVSCWLCNAFKSNHNPDELNWTPQNESKYPRWRGLTELLDKFTDAVRAERQQPGTPVWRLERLTESARLEHSVKVNGYVRDSISTVQVAVASLENLGSEYDLSSIDAGKARRIADDSSLPMFWIYTDSASKWEPNVQLQLDLLPAGREREAVHASLTPLLEGRPASPTNPVIRLDWLGEHWEEARPVLERYIEAVLNG